MKTKRKTLRGSIVENNETKVDIYSTDITDIKIINGSLNISIDNGKTYTPIAVNLDDFNNLVKNKTLIKNDSDGFSGGHNAGTTAGGAIGKNSYAERGGAAGFDSETAGGFSGGYFARSYDGAALGNSSTANNGGAVGRFSYSNNGGAIGDGALAGDGFSGGKEAKVAGNPAPGKPYIDAIQLGTGTNNKEKSLQVYDDNLWDSINHRLGTALLDAIFPVDTIISFAGELDPNVKYGGTWVRIKGRVLFGADEEHPLGSIGGEETHTLTIDEMPSHTHIQNEHNHSQNPHTHTLYTPKGDKNYGGTPNGNVYWGDNNERTNVTNPTTATNNSVTATNQNTGGGQPHNNMMPYAASNIWKRIA